MPTLKTIALLSGLVQHSFEIDAWAIRMGPAVDVKIRGEPGDARLIRQRSVGRQVGPGVHIMRMGALSHPPDGAARETRTGLGDGP